MSVRLPIKYPALDLCELSLYARYCNTHIRCIDSPVYPYNLEEIYPPVAASTKADPTAYPWSVYNIYGGKTTVRSTSPARISLKATARRVDPTAYPWSVYNIYAGVSKVGPTSPVSKAGVRATDPTAYPWSMYNIYAGVPRVGPTLPLLVRSPAAYPKINLCECIHLTVIPLVHSRLQTQLRTRTSISIPRSGPLRPHQSPFSLALSANTLCWISVSSIIFPCVSRG